MLSLVNITLSRGNKTIINNSTVEGSTGEVIAVIGENGAGKTTLLHFIAGILKSDSGNIYFEGNKININSEWWKKKVSYVLDDGGTIPLLTVEEQINLQCLLLGISPKESKIRTDYMIELLGLRKYCEYRSDELSTGLNKRLGIGIGIVRNAKIYLFDEPFSFLDIETISIFLKIIKILKKRNRIVIIATHSLSALDAIYDQVWAISSNTIQTFSKGNDFDMNLQNSNIRKAFVNDRALNIPWIK